MRRWTRWQDWVNLIAGAWLFVSPWVLVTTFDAASSWNAWAVGAAVFLVALWALYYPGSRIAEWINAALGAWLFISPWVLGFVVVATSQAWNAWITGFVVFWVALWALWRMQAPTTYQ
ncbi:MAG: SPW repeat protein [Chloroflexota bacterium]